MSVHAVLIGIGEYAHLPSLQYCSDDIDKIHAALSTLADLHIAATLTPREGLIWRNDVLECVDDVSKRINAEDALLIYFSGHGLVDNDEFVLCTSDVRPDNGLAAQTGIPLNSLVAITSQTAHAVLIVVDCCRSPLESRELPSGGDVDKMPLVLVRENVYLMFSCVPGQNSYESPDPDVQGSLFTHCLCEGLRAAGGRREFFSLQQLSEYIETRLLDVIIETYQRWAQREPEFIVQTPAILGADFAKYCLRRKRKEPARRAKRRQRAN